MPRSLQFLHISYLSLLITGGEVVVTVVFSYSSVVAGFLDSYESVDDDEVTFPKLDSASGCLFYYAVSVFYLT